MQKTVFRPSTWLCLLGSVLALVAFFLPYYGPTPESLAEMQLSLIRQQPQLQELRVFAALSLMLLPTLLGEVALAIWALCLREPGGRRLTWYLNLTKLVFFYSCAVLGLTLYFNYVLGEIYNPPSFYPVGIGAWAMPLSLLLALIGGMLLRRQVPQRAS